MAVALAVGLSALTGCGGDADGAAPADDTAVGDDAATAGGGSAGAPGPGGGLSVSEALASELEGPLMVRGSIVSTGGETRLCEALAESMPPRCGGASLRVVGLDLASLDGVTTAGDVTWVDGVSLLGSVDGDTFTVSRTST